MNTKIINLEVQGSNPCILFISKIMESKQTREFTLIFLTKWTEEELLLNFRKEILKNPKLYSNNTFNKLKPIKLMKTFSELNNYIQLFNFKDIEFPLYYGLAIALKHCYEKNQTKDEAILFKTTWEIGGIPIDEYKFSHELPYNNKLFLSFKILPKEQYTNLWKNK